MLILYLNIMIHLLSILFIYTSLSYTVEHKKSHFSSRHSLSSKKVVSKKPAHLMENPFPIRIAPPNEVVVKPGFHA